MLQAPIATPGCYQRNALLIHAPLSASEEFLLGGEGWITRNDIYIRVRERNLDHAVLMLFFSPLAAQLLTVLYSIANDAPYWRTPLIEADVNQLLDQLGVRRARNGYHYSYARKQIKQLLLGLGKLEVSLPGSEIFAPLAEEVPVLHGRPAHTFTLMLGHYQGVREGALLGKDYVLLPRVSPTRTAGRAGLERMLLGTLRSMSFARRSSRVCTRVSALAPVLLSSSRQQRCSRARLLGALKRLEFSGEILSSTLAGRGQGALLTVQLKEITAVSTRAFAR